MKTTQQEENPAPKVIASAKESKTAKNTEQHKRLQTRDASMWKGFMFFK